MLQAPAGSSALAAATLAGLLLALPARVGAQADAAPAAGTEAAAHRATLQPDPWLMVRVGTRARTARANLGELDQALVPHHVRYAGLTPEDRARIRQAYAELLPSLRFTVHRMNPQQARAVVYLALGHWDRCDRDGRRGHQPRGHCTAAVDSMSRDAAWIRAKILGLGRTGTRRPRREELSDLQEMVERARGMMLESPRCGCAGAREEAEELFVALRDATDAHEASSLPARMSLGSARVQRIARLADTVERTLLRCLGDDR